MTSKEQVLALLIERGRLTCKEIGEEIGLDPKCVSWHCRTLRKNSQAYIADYIVYPDSKPAYVWAAGDEPDAPRPTEAQRKAMLKREPKPRSQGERKITMAERERLSEEFEAREDAKRRARLLAEIVPFRDPFLFLTAGATA